MDLFRDARAAAAFASEKMKKVNLFDTARLFCDVYGLLPGQEQTAHAHAGADKIYFVLDGTAMFDIGGEQREVGGGWAVLAPAGSSHAVRNRSNAPATLLVMMAPKP